jgi:hypothetical protein
MVWTTNMAARGVDAARIEVGSCPVNFLCP